MVEPCCEIMKQQLEWTCETHPLSCPNNIIRVVGGEPLLPDWEEHLVTCPACSNDVNDDIHMNGIDEAEGLCRVCGCQWRLQMQVKVTAIFAEGRNDEIWQQVKSEFEEDAHE